jgi:hypothetical protein
MRKLLPLVALVLASCGAIPQVPEIPKAAGDAVQNAATFVATLQPLKAKCSKADALQEFCAPFMVADARLESAVVRAKRALVAGEQAQDELVQVRDAMRLVWDALTKPASDDPDGGSP